MLVHECDADGRPTSASTTTRTTSYATGYYPVFRLRLMTALLDAGAAWAFYLEGDRFFEATVVSSPPAASRHRCSTPIACWPDWGRIGCRCDRAHPRPVRWSRRSQPARSRCVRHNCGCGCHCDCRSPSSSKSSRCDDRSCCIVVRANREGPRPIKTGRGPSPRPQRSGCPRPGWRWVPMSRGRRWWCGCSGASRYGCG